MSDSVDRVFSHALNTVNKIRTGSQKPPSATRLRLYGLYKQAMEGNVDGIMERPQGRDESQQRAGEKWDAWKEQNGISRTEAKRRYITTLIDTMHRYASPSPDSRELVAELEFVWDQVKSNVPSSSPSSPRNQDDDEPGNRPLRIVSPMSQSERDLEQMEAQIDGGDEFVDAPDSQATPYPNHDDTTGVQPGLQPSHLHPTAPYPLPTPTSNPTPSPDKHTTTTSSSPAADAKWRTRIETTLINLTAEIAALREQLEARRLFAYPAHYRFFRCVYRWAWALARHLAVNALLLAVLLVWMRGRGDGRLEAVLRGVVGAAVHRVRRDIGRGLGRVGLGRARVGDADRCREAG